MVEALTPEIPEGGSAGSILESLVETMTDVGLLSKMLRIESGRSLLLHVTRRLIQLEVRVTDLTDNSANVYDVISREIAPFSPTPQYQALDTYRKVQWLITEAYKWGDRYEFPWPYTLYPQYCELRRVGEELHSRGGLASMQRAAQQVGMRQRPLLSHIWHGVGDWMD